MSNGNNRRRMRPNFYLGIVFGVAIAETFRNIAGGSFQFPDVVSVSYGSYPTRSLELIEPTIRSVELIEQSTETSKEKETFHVLFGMMGEAPSLYDAWEVSLKSVLVNAPTDVDMHVHVICSQDAHNVVQEKIKEAELEGSQWRNQITITSYNVEAYNRNWREFLREKMRHDQLYERISLGGYYRLLAYKILAPLNVGPTLYMDTDVIVLSNLNDLVKNIDGTKLFQGSSKFFCSGFTVINMAKFHEFWEKVDQLEQVRVVDQDIMLDVLTKFPDTYGHLPLEWDRNLGNGYRRRPHKILNHKEAAGMLHYQGGSGRDNDQNYFTYGFEQYCDRTPTCRDNKELREMVARSWGLGDYYTRLTWKWALFFGKSAIAPDQEGFELRVDSVIANHTAVAGNASATNLTMLKETTMIC
ncbi:hypothetical protein FRACYDRAFT_232642 [Fragilariopsis cylindrus CCMP1102]|uniref:Nucleotide-diphospho-sugar transferase domain-containing protein n=1 Tax=Fragilariopsis cylindrus CCMP1102 TaxID=635003 RepID=A0A1E7FWH7_9STRA|nr:hypothetical protein FRACYDRAFT_232642 [Fragilariopsis cylindrus CCMP1102]|eukprot:OEU22485.1 hypothetical protein FRACYDRAFT_232642 [Fragilariopsis cylindrus CCMP1102]